MSDQLKIALYGKFGSRKTLQIGHLCDLVGRENVVVLSADQGLNTVRSKIEPTNVITPTRYFAGDGLDFEAAKKMAGEAVKRLGPACWLCVDGGSEIHKWIKNEIFEVVDSYHELRCEGGEIPGELKKIGRYFTGKGTDVTLDGQRVYGKIGEISERMLSGLKALPCNLYVNYLEDMQTDNDRKKTLPWGPHVPGKMGLDAIMSTFDMVGRVSYGSCGTHTAGKCPVYPEQHLLAGFNPQARDYMARTRDDRAGGVRIPSDLILDFDLGRFVAKIAPTKAEAVEAAAK